jgi:hypothetical protein
MTPDNAILEFMFAGLTVIGLFLITAAAICVMIWIAGKLS